MSFLKTATTEEIIDRLKLFRSSSLIRFGSATSEIFHVYKANDVIWSISIQTLTKCGCRFMTYPMSNLSTDEEIAALASTLNLQ